MKKLLTSLFLLLITCSIGYCYTQNVQCKLEVLQTPHPKEVTSNPGIGEIVEPDESLELSILNGDKDLSSNDIALTNVNAALGNGIETTGSEYLSFSAVTFTDEFTISVWAKNANGAGFDHAIVGHSSFSNRLLSKFAGNFLVRVVNSGSSDNTITGISDNKWNHIVLTRDSSNKVDLYVNGNKNRLFDDVAQVGNSVWNRLNADSALFYDGKIKHVDFYSSHKDQEWVTKEYKKVIPDESLELSILNGDKDLSRNDVSLTNTGVIVGNGMEYDGIDKVLNVGDLGDFQEFTFKCWFQADTSGEGGFGRFIDRNEFRVFVGSSNEIRFDTSALSSDNVFVFGTWYSLIVTRDSSNLLTCYINGVNVGTLTDSSLGAGDYGIGNRDSLGRTFDGKIKDIEFFSETKDQAWATSEYQRNKIFY